LKSLINNILFISFLLPCTGISFAQPANCSYNDLASQTNLVYNGDFQLGDTGFTTDYTFSTANPLDAGHYNIVTDASTIHFGFTGYDHTSGNGTGYFMVINGASTVANDWCQTVSVQQNSYYRFSAWFKNIVKKPQYAGLAIANVELHINGQKVSKNISLPDYPDVWVMLDTLWYSGSSTSVDLCMYDASTAGNGNDFAIDDISFKLCKNCPVVDVGPDQIICKGDSAQLNVTSDSNGTYLWSPNLYITNKDISNPKVSPPGNRKYVVSLTTIGGCIVKDSLIVFVRDITMTTGSDQTICKGDSAQLSASSTFSGNYKWTPKFNISDTSIANPKVAPTISTKYLVSFTSNGCTVKDSITINVTDLHANAGPDINSCKKDVFQLNGTGNGNFFTWSPIKYINNNIISNPTVNPDTNITYVLAVSNGICTSHDTMNVFVTSIDAAINNNDTSVCSGDTVQLSTFINGSFFSWSPKLFMNDTHSVVPFVFPPSTTKYLLTVSRGSCIKKDSVTINVVNNVFADAGTDQQVCKGSSVQLSASGSTGARFSWLPNYALSDPSIPNPIATPFFDTSYFLKVKVGKNCIGYDTVRIKVNPIPSVYAGLDQHICRQLYVPIGVSSSNADSFYWSPSTGLSDINVLQTQASPSSNTTYFIKAINKVTYCFNFDTVNVTLIKPTAAFYANPSSGQVPLDVLFTNASTNATNYFWDFGDTTSPSSQINPEHTFTKEGSYKVMLVAEDSGCTDTAYKIIDATGGLLIFIPNVITANDDGLNDEFVISYTKSALKKMHGSIWNRWGEKIYEFDMPDGKWWDGKFKGNIVQEDTYVYIIEATDLKDKIQVFKGNFTLLR